MLAITKLILSLTIIAKLYVIVNCIITLLLGLLLGNILLHLNPVYRCLKLMLTRVHLLRSAAAWRNSLAWSRSYCVTLHLCLSLWPVRWKVSFPLSCCFQSSSFTHFCSTTGNATAGVSFGTKFFFKRICGRVVAFILK